MNKQTFSEKCYQLLRKVPEGKVTTYKAIAEKLGTKGYRAVGMAMNRNPHIPVIPCHRVVCSDGTLGGYALGLHKKKALLKKEGVELAGNKVADLSAVMHRFR